MPDFAHHVRTQLTDRSPGLIGLIATCAVVIGGCGSNAVSSGARQAAQAACLQATTNIKDATAKQSADQACRAVGSGNQTQLTLAAKLAARQACLQASQQIAGPALRAQAKSVCPAVK